MRSKYLIPTFCGAVVIVVAHFGLCESVHQVDHNVDLDPNPDPDPPAATDWDIDVFQANQVPCGQSGECTCKENGNSSTLMLLQCANVQEINLSQQKISAVDPDAFNGHCFQLQLLNMSMNQIERLPSKTFASCSRLVSLSLSHNRLEELPDDMLGPCTRLQALNVSLNNLKTIPDWFSTSCKQLETLDLSWNEISKLVLHDCTQFGSLRNLYLSGNMIESISSTSLSSCDHLETLWLGNNLLANVSSQMFSSMKSLRMLDLHDNDITNLDILKLPSLGYLDISCNKIGCLPFRVRSLPWETTFLCNVYHSYSCRGQDNPGCSKHCNHCSQSINSDVQFLPFRAGKRGGFCMYNIPTFSWGIEDYIPIFLGSLAFLGLTVLLIYCCSLWCSRDSCSKSYLHKRPTDSNSTTCPPDEVSTALPLGVKSGKTEGDTELADLRQPLIKEEPPHRRPRAIGPEEVHKNEEKAFDKTDVEQDFASLIAFYVAQKKYVPWQFERAVGASGLFEIAMALSMGLVLANSISPWSDQTEVEYSKNPQANKALSLKVGTFPIAQIFVAILGFRFGYLGTKYINYALAVFHGSSIDSMIAEKVPNRIKFAEGEEADNSCCEKCKTRVQKFASQVGTVLTYLLEFVQALQICLPVITPYMRSVHNRGQEVNQGVSILQAVNIDISWGSETKFYCFLYTTIGFMGLLFLSAVIPICLGEPWMMRALKLSRQAVCIAEYEILRFVSDRSGCFQKAYHRALSAVPKTLKFSFDIFLRCERPNKYRNKWWPRAFFRFMNLLIGFTFIPVTRHLIGLFIDPEMYPDMGGTSPDDDEFDDSVDDDMVFPSDDMWKYRAALCIVILWYFLYSIVYCFADIIMVAVRSQVDQPTERKGLLLHPRFLYKMLFARLVILVFVNNTGKKLDNGSYKADAWGITPSNSHVRIISTVVAWWIVCAHLGFQRYFCFPLCRKLCQNNDQELIMQLQSANARRAEDCSSATSLKDAGEAMAASNNSTSFQDGRMGDWQNIQNYSHTKKSDVEVVNSGDSVTSSGFGQVVEFELPNPQKYVERHDVMKYPSEVEWFNIRHRGALVFVALFSTLVLIESGAHMFPRTFMLWACSIFLVTAFATELAAQWQLKCP